MLIGSYTLCGTPIEKDGKALESSHPTGPPGLSQKSLNEWVIHSQVDSIFSKESRRMDSMLDSVDFTCSLCAFSNTRCKLSPSVLVLLG